MSAVPLGLRGTGPIQPPNLCITHQGKELQRIALKKRIVSVGRSPDNDVVLDADGVSRHHLQIITVQGESLVEDLGSRNGTYVNNSWMRVRQLRHGDDIVVAKFRLRFLCAQREDQLNVGQLLHRWGLASARRGAIAKVCPTCGAHWGASN